MKTKVSFFRNRASLWAIGSLAALLAVGTPAFAQHGGGGGGHGGGGGGGGGHSGGFGGGGHSGGFGGGHAAGFAGGHAMVGGARGYAGGYGGGPHYSPRVGYSAGFRGGYAGGSVASVHAYGGHVGGFAGRSAYVGHPGYGYGYGHGGFGWHRPYWGGGYWRGGYWPRAYYGWGYPWFLGVLPAVYATYWWGGIPYYYANDVYYTYNTGSNGYVVTDPPPVDTGDSDSSGGDGGYASADPGTTSGASAATGSPDVYAYPKSGQSDEQQSTDRYECHKWAVAQSGFDPTHTAQGSGNTADYRRAMTACLDGRGYSAK
jgi:hypothetical protein